MPKKKNPDTEKPTDKVAVIFRCTVAERDAMDEIAAAVVKSRTHVILKSVAGQRIYAKTDVHTLNELRRIGGLLKHTLNTTHGYGPQLINVLHELKEAILRVGR